MKLVRATSQSYRTGKKIKELGRIANEGELFTVSDSRFEFLSGANPLRKVFVTAADDVIESVAKAEQPTQELVGVPDDVAELNLGVAEETSENDELNDDIPLEIVEDIVNKIEESVETTNEADGAALVEIVEKKTRKPRKKKEDDAE